MINLEQIILNVLKEETTAAGALGDPAGGTSQFSSDFYAPGDNRIPYSIYGKGGVMTRKGLIKGKKKRKKKKRKKKK
jgi:hypothetical protein